VTLPEQLRFADAGQPVEGSAARLAAGIERPGGRYSDASREITCAFGDVADAATVQALITLKPKADTPRPKF
jgi:hypothetical protein